MIILTGASGGIGQAILPLLSSLDSVVAIYNNKVPDVSGMTNVTTYQLNLILEREVADFAKAMKGRLEKITIIHAAALSRDGLAAELNMDDWEQVINVNLRGNFLLTQAMIRPMIAEKWGRIIHFSSVAGIRGEPGTVAYSTTKTGLIGMSKVLANEYARFGITSNVLVLGYFSAGLIKTLSEKMRNKILESVPSGRLGESSNIVNAVEFIMRSEYVNGSSIHLDGGI